MANPVPAPVGIDLSALPARNLGSRVDFDAARSWLAAIEANGAASDGASYDTASDARNAGMRLTRLVDHVAPDGMNPSVRTFGLDANGTATADPDATVGYGFAISLKSPKADKADKPKSGK